MSADPLETAYVRMAKEARYRPAAPSDGYGTLDLAEEARQYARDWRENEHALGAVVGYPDGRDRQALVFMVEAARATCGMLPTRVSGKLLLMALDDLIGGDPR